MDNFVLGLGKHIHTGKPLEPSFLMQIIQKCRTREETDMWVNANDIGCCIQPADGFQNSINHLHTLRMNCPFYKGMIYIDWGLEQPRKQAHFKGSFGGRLKFHLGEKGVPQLVKRNTVFTLKDNENIKYTVIWANLMEDADPAAAKEFRVSSISQEKPGPRSFRWVFHSRTASPFGKESGKHVALVEWLYDRNDIESFCLKMDAQLESFEEIIGLISGYLTLEVCAEDHVQVKGSKSQFDDSKMELWITLLNQMLGEGLVRLVLKETRVMKPDLHLYMVLAKENVSEGSTEVPVEAETGQDSFEDFEFGSLEPNFSDDDVFASFSGNPLYDPVREEINALMPPHSDEPGTSDRLSTTEIYNNSETQQMPGYDYAGNITLAGRITAKEVSIRQDGHLFLGGNADILQLSDMNEKENIEQMGRDSYQKIMKLQTYFFSYKNSSNKRAGFIAQQVKKHIEEAVTQDENGVHYVSVGTLIPFIVQALQAQDKSIDKHEGMIMLILGALLDLLKKWEREFGGQEPESDETEDSSEGGDKDRKDSGKEESEEEDFEKEFFCKELTHHDKVCCLIRELEEKDDQHKYFLKLVSSMDAEVLWQAKEAAKKSTSLKDDGTPRSKGGEFIKLVKLHKKKMEVRKTMITSPEVAVELRSYQQQAVKVATENWDPKIKQAGSKNFCYVAPTGSGKTRIFIECIRNGLVKFSGLKALVIIPNIALSKQHEGSFMMGGFGEAGWRVESYSSEHSVNRTSWPTELEKQSVMIMTAQIFLNLLEDGAAHMEQLHLIILDEVHHARSRSPYKKIMEHYNKAKARNKAYVPKVLGFSASPANHDTRAGTYKKLVDLRELLDAKLVLIPDDHHEIQKHVPTPDERTIFIEPRQQDEDFDRGMQTYKAQAIDRLTAHLRRFIADENAGPTVAKKFVAFFSENNGRSAAETFLDNHPELSNLSRLEMAELLASAQLLQECENSLQVLKEFGYERALAHCAQKCIEIMESFNLNLEGMNVNISSHGFFKQLVFLLCNTAPVNDSRFVTSALGQDVLCHGKSFPKFVELIHLLETEYVKEKEFFHGMIFIETRAGVHHLSHMLRSDPRTRSIQFIEFTGHGCSKKSDYANVKGMTGRMQERQLRSFRQQGRKILVATQAAEEGLDIVDCEFVIRYTAPKTGIQRVQSKGRTRKKGSVYVSLITKKSLDEKMEAKSKAEETNLQWVMKKIDSIIIE
ncbi:hypothetical protein BSKO_13324 [Bryopsis sp. KO-2023]|nr:hypothetical protein BSKO_13324 [Bryopsis sp. KO-2023]